MGPSAWHSYEHDRILYKHDCITLIQITHTFSEFFQEELVLVLGRNDFDYYAGKIWQLKFCEEAAFGII